ncbi:MAG: CotH kinase family protein [Saprospiraceae bacterium]
MLKQITKLLLFACLFCFTTTAIQAQSLPNDMYLSTDGRTLYTGGQTTTGLYDQSIIRNIDLTFGQTNYWTLLTSNYASGTDLEADMTVDGVSYPGVGVRFKGNTSYTMVQGDKKSFNVTTDFMDENQDLMGYSTLNFNNCFQDPSFLREFIFLNQIRNYVPAAKASFIKLTINDQDWGIYPHVQQINGDFLNEWFLSNDGTRWRAISPDGVGGPGGGGPGGGGPGGGGPGGGGGGQWGAGTTALNYLGADTTLYQDHYTLKKANKANPWDDLVKVTDILENTPLADLEDSLENYLDIDRTLWFLASEILFTDDDGYVYKGEMDYYLYWEVETGRMVPLEFDGNSVIDPAKATTWTPFHNSTNANYPLLNRMLAVPSIRQRYLAHFRTMLEQSLAPANINPILTQYSQMIDAEVQADPKKLESYAAFQSEVTTLQNFFSTRYNYLSNLASIDVTSPTVGSVSYTTNGQQWQKPLAFETVNITANASSPDGLAEVNMYYSDALVGNFTKVEMFDDGQHNDGGGANDGVFGAEIPGFDVGTNVRFYIEAVSANNVNTVSYMPEGAEHDVYYYNVAVGTSNNTDIVINELMASNDATVADNAGDYDDWIELYNTSGSTVDLSGWYITDKTDNLTKYDIPSGTHILGNDYLIIWADEDSSQGPNPVHANFKLSSGGELVMLLDASVLLVDSVSFGQQTTDMGYARVPNGTGNFVIQAPTYNGNNDVVSTEGVEQLEQFQLFPNPTHGILNVTLENDGSDFELFEVFDATGRKLREINVSNQQFQVDLSDLGEGLYVLKYGETVKRVLILK